MYPAASRLMRYPHAPPFLRKIGRNSRPHGVCPATRPRQRRCLVWMALWSFTTPCPAGHQESGAETSASTASPTTASSSRIRAAGALVERSAAYAAQWLRAHPTCPGPMTRSAGSSVKVQPSMAERRVAERPISLRLAEMARHRSSRRSRLMTNTGICMSLPWPGTASLVSGRLHTRDISWSRLFADGRRVRRPNARLFHSAGDPTGRVPCVQEGACAPTGAESTTDALT